MGKKIRPTCAETSSVMDLISIICGNRAIKNSDTEFMCVSDWGNHVCNVVYFLQNHKIGFYAVSLPFIDCCFKWPRFSFLTFKGQSSHLPSLEVCLQHNIEKWSKASKTGLHVGIWGESIFTYSQGDMRRKKLIAWYFCKHVASARCLPRGQWQM